MDEEEIKSFIHVWISAIASLCYCYSIARHIPEGALRFLSILPVVFLFTILPLKLTSYHLGVPTAFFLVWLCNFKLLLLSFNEGPLVQALNLPLFISTACLPIKIRPKQDQNPNPTTPSPKGTILRTATKVMLLALIFKAYTYKPYLHPNIILAFYCIHMYIELEILLAVCATPARTLLGFELEPQFDEPYLSTSLQDFWGHRWNLMVTKILRPTVYHPVRRASTHILGRDLSSLLAVIATFTVSGLMHELIYYYAIQVRPTWEVTLFFVLHGVCVTIEMAVKRSLGEKWRLHRAVSGPLTLMFLVVTGKWLFFAQLMRNGADEKVIGELFSFFGFVKYKISLILPIARQVYS